MLNLVFAFTLLVFACAIVLLFAMFGELASRVPESPRIAKRVPLRPVEGARIGHQSTSWPPKLERLATEERGILLVLSTVCASCADIAHKLGADPRFARDLVIAISCGSKEAGDAFVTRHGLQDIDHFVDLQGEWVREQFAIMVSPSGLFFSGGRLQSAYIFQDIDSVLAGPQAVPIPEHIGGVFA